MRKLQETSKLATSPVSEANRSERSRAGLTMTDNGGGASRDTTRDRGQCGYRKETSKLATSPVSEANRLGGMRGVGRAAHTNP